MKRITSIFASVLILGAVTANAGYITWALGVGTITDPDLSTNLGGAPVYLLYGDAATVEASILGGSFVANYGSGPSATTHPGGGTLVNDAIWASETAPFSAQNFFFVAFDGVAGAGNYMISDTLSGTLVDENDSLQVPQTLTFTAAQANTWQAVPEPGTIALAIAGIGALIARRRRNRK